MNQRFVAVCISLAGLLVASADVFAQRGGGMGRGMGGAMGGIHSGGVQPGAQRGGGMLDSAPVERGGDAQDRGRGASSERQGTERQGQGAENAAAKTPGDLLQQNPKLADNLAKLLPAGTDLQAAASGFGNLGEFVSAVHVSNNLGIPFADLKARLIAGDSLGAAIQALKPEADAQIETRRARARAEADLGKG